MSRTAYKTRRRRHSFDTRPLRLRIRRKPSRPALPPPPAREVGGLLYTWPVPTIEENRTYWGRGYRWPDNGHEWSVGAGGTPYVWHGTIMPRLCGFLPVRDILELAPGHGRFT